MIQWIKSWWTGPTSAFSIAINVGFTVWSVLTHQPLWFIVFCFMSDTFLTLNYLTRARKDNE